MGESTEKNKVKFTFSIDMQICRYKQILEWRKQKKKEPLQDKTEIHIIRKI